METTQACKPYPRFIRLGRFDVMVERRASLWRIADWFRPSTLTTEGGDWLAWCGPVHVAVSKV